MATEEELSEFLKNVEKRAFKRCLYHVGDVDTALDIVQDSMIKLCTRYGDKPLAELGPLFQEILSNKILDAFRRRKTRQARFVSMSEFESSSTDLDFDPIDALRSANNEDVAGQSAEETVSRAQQFHQIEAAVMELPARQREAFLMRYWEEMDIAETAAAMGCSPGSVKIHCSRAVAALSTALKAKGIRL